MKKIFTLAVLMAVMTMTAQAQGISFGAKAGLNISKMSFSEDVFESSNKLGFFLGPVVKVSLAAGLGVDGAVLYDQRDTEVTAATPSGSAVGTGTETITQKSFMIPINLRYTIGLGKSAGVYLAAGPQFGFPIGDKWYNTEVGDYRLRDANLSVNFGAGLSLLGFLEVGFTYNLAAGKSGEFTDFGDIDTHNNAWQINAAVFF